LDEPYLFGNHTYAQAVIAAHLEQKDRAVTLLRTALAQGVGYPRLHTYLILWEPIWDHPGFIELLKPRQ
jgi:hypothetical protein